MKNHVSQVTLAFFFLRKDMFKDTADLRKPLSLTHLSSESTGLRSTGPRARWVTSTFNQSNQIIDQIPLKMTSHPHILIHSKIRPNCCFTVSLKVLYVSCCYRHMANVSIKSCLLTSLEEKLCSASNFVPLLTDSCLQWCKATPVLTLASLLFQSILFFY